MSNHLKRKLGTFPGVPTFFRPELPPNALAHMTITVMKDGQTKVTGPLGNRALCEAILQDAANVIKAYSPKSEAEEQKPDAGIIVEQPRIIVPG